MDDARSLGKFVNNVLFADRVKCVDVFGVRVMYLLISLLNLTISSWLIWFSLGLYILSL